MGEQDGTRGVLHKLTRWGVEGEGEVQPALAVLLGLAVAHFRKLIPPLISPSGPTSRMLDLARCESSLFLVTPITYYSSQLENSNMLGMLWFMRACI